MMSKGRGCWTRHPTTLDQEREHSVGRFEELQLDEVMVFVAKLVTFLVVCGICSVTTAVGFMASNNHSTCTDPAHLLPQAILVS